MFLFTTTLLLESRSTVVTCTADRPLRTTQYVFCVTTGIPAMYQGFDSCSPASVTLTPSCLLWFPAIPLWWPPTGSHSSYTIFCYPYITVFLSSLVFLPQTTSPFSSEQNLSSQAVYSKPLPATANHIGGGGGGGGGESSPEEVEVLLAKQKGTPRQPSFLRALIKAFGPYFLIGSAYKLLQDIITFVNPELLRWSQSNQLPWRA